MALEIYNRVNEFRVVPPDVNVFECTRNSSSPTDCEAMPAIRNISPSSSVNSNSESVMSKEMVQNVGRSAGNVFRATMMPVILDCDLGDDIVMKISSVCQIQNQMSCLICGLADVKDPSIILWNNEIIRHEGIYTVLHMAGFTSPNDTNGDSASLQFSISIPGPGNKVFAGRVSGPLISASKTTVGLLLMKPVEDLNDDTDVSSDADTNNDAESSSCLTSI